MQQVWRLLALPGAHSYDAFPMACTGNAFGYVFSSTFQYASLMNFDQLSIRTLCAA